VSDEAGRPTDGLDPSPRRVPSDFRFRAWAIVACFALTLAYGLLLLSAFDPGVQDVDAAELVERRDDARAFLIADLFFPLIYGVLSPLAQWRFRAALRSRDTHGRRPAAKWIAAAAILLAAAGLFDLTENVLLLSATSSESRASVDAAHAVAVPKAILFVAGALLAVLVLARAISALRAGRSGPAPEPVKETS
jgi:hypothetical protein